jgi:hypothetical protein
MTIAYPLRPVGELVDNFDARRRPVKGSDRRAGKYPYYGAQGIVDYVDSFLFDGTYVLVAEDGENLRSKKMPVALIASGKFWVNNHAHVLKGNDKIDTAFLRYALNAVDISGYITGSTIPKLSTGSLDRILIPSPPPQEQRVIASVLSSLDDKIDLNRRMNETLETMARAIFKDWFVDFGPTRAKIEGRTPYLSSEIWTMFPDRLDDDERPVGWPIKKWGEVASLEYGKRLEGYQTVGGKVPFYRSGRFLKIGVRLLGKTKGAGKPAGAGKQALRLPHEVGFFQAGQAIGGLQRDGFPHRFQHLRRRDAREKAFCGRLPEIGHIEFECGMQVIAVPFRRIRASLHNIEGESREEGQKLDLHFLRHFHEAGPEIGMVARQPVAPHRAKAV